MTARIITSNSKGEKTINGKIISRGFGDTVAKMTKAVGIKPCGGCKNAKNT